MSDRGLRLFQIPSEPEAFIIYWLGWIALALFAVALITVVMLP